MAELTAIELEHGRVSVEVNGEFDLADEQRAQGLVDAALESSNGLLIDLSDCTFIDSIGLRLLLRTYRRAEGKSLPFAIAGSGPEVHKVLDITGLRETLPIYRERLEALRAIEPEVT